MSRDQTSWLEGGEGSNPIPGFEATISTIVEDEDDTNKGKEPLSATQGPIHSDKNEQEYVEYDLDYTEEETEHRLGLRFTSLSSSFYFSSPSKALIEAAERQRWDFLSTITAVSEVYQTGSYLKMMLLKEQEWTTLGQGSVFHVTHSTVKLAAYSIRNHRQMETVNNKLVMKRNYGASGPLTSRQVRALVKELRVMHHLAAHPFIVGLRGVGWFEERDPDGDPGAGRIYKPALLLEYADHTLDYLVSGEGDQVDLAYDDMLEIFAQITSALCALHRCKIAHGDLKPANILLFRQTVVREGVQKDSFIAKLSDFESAVFEADRQFQYSPGTIGYEPPEANIHNANSSVTFRHLLLADAWSLGIVFAVVLSGTKEPLHTLLDPMRRSQKFVRLICQKIESSTALGSHIEVLEELYQLLLCWNPEKRRLYRVEERLNAFVRGLNTKENLHPGQLEDYSEDNLTVCHQALKNMGGPFLDQVVAQLEAAIVTSESHDRRVKAKWELGVFLLSRFANPRESIDKGLNYVLQAAQEGDLRAKALCHRLHEAFGRPYPASDDLRLSRLEDAVRGGYLSALVELQELNPERAILAQAGHAASSMPLIVGSSPLHVAAATGKRDECELMLRKGKFVLNPRTAEYDTPLILACRFGQVETARILLEYDTDASARNTFGENALHYVWCFGVADGVDMLRRLVARGASIHDVSTRRLTASDLDILPILPGTPVERAVGRARFDLVQEFLYLEGWIGKGPKHHNRFISSSETDVRPAGAEDHTAHILRNRVDNRDEICQGEGSSKAEYFEGKMELAQESKSIDPLAEIDDSAKLITTLTHSRGIKVNRKNDTNGRLARILLLWALRLQDTRTVELILSCMRDTKLRKRNLSPIVRTKWLYHGEERTILDAACAGWVSHAGIGSHYPLRFWLVCRHGPRWKYAMASAVTHLVASHIGDGDSSWLVEQDVDKSIYFAIQDSAPDAFSALLRCKFQHTPALTSRVHPRSFDRLRWGREELEGQNCEPKDVHLIDRLSFEKEKHHHHDMDTSTLAQEALVSGDRYLFRLLTRKYHASVCFPMQRIQTRDTGQKPTSLFNLYTALLYTEHQDLWFADELRALHMPLTCPWTRSPFSYSRFHEQPFKHTTPPLLNALLEKDLSYACWFLQRGGASLTDLISGNGDTVLDAIMRSGSKRLVAFFFKGTQPESLYEGGGALLPADYRSGDAVLVLFMEANARSLPNPRVFVYPTTLFCVFSLVWFGLGLLLGVPWGLSLGKISSDLPWFRRDDNPKKWWEEDFVIHNLEQLAANYRYLLKMYPNAHIPKTRSCLEVLVALQNFKADGGREFQSHFRYIAEQHKKRTQRLSQVGSWPNKRLRDYFMVHPQDTLSSAGIANVFSLAPGAELHHLAPGFWWLPVMGPWATAANTLMWLLILYGSGFFSSQEAERSLRVALIFVIFCWDRLLIMQLGYIYDPRNWPYEAFAGEGFVIVFQRVQTVLATIFLLIYATNKLVSNGSNITRSIFYATVATAIAMAILSMGRFMSATLKEVGSLWRLTRSSSSEKLLSITLLALPALAMMLGLSVQAMRSAWAMQTAVAGWREEGKKIGITLFFVFYLLLSGIFYLIGLYCGW